MAKARLFGALAATLLAAALPAAGNAAVLTFDTGDATSGSFGNFGIAATNSFTDTLTFSLTSAGIFSASLGNSVSTAGGTGDIDFTSVALIGAGSPLPFDITNNDTSLGAFDDYADFSGFLEAGTYTLSITGRSFGGAQYSGTTSLSAVPEPASWAMMLGGFGILGAGLRRRRAGGASSLVTSAR